MIWVHCGDSSEVTTALSLVARLREHNENARVLLTADPQLLPDIGPLPDGAKPASVPPDTPTKTRAFIDDFSPRVLIWVGGALRPNLLRAVEKADTAATLINARNTALLAGAPRWFRGAARSAVGAFETILCADGATATRLVRAGVPRDVVKATGPILDEPISLPHNQYEHTVMAEALGTRPLWYAANVVNEEVTHMAAAHLAASRKSHRLLMLLTPRNVDDGPKVADLLREAGLKVGVRSDGDNPLAEHQAYVTDLPGEVGLWYRLAPLSFMGGTLTGGGSPSPFESIMLGSAVVHGTYKSPHEAQFERLAKAEACREIRSAGELGIAIGALISPEQTARIALAGWEEITRNADTINALVNDALITAEDAA